MGEAWCRLAWGWVGLRGRGLGNKVRLGRLEDSRVCISVCVCKWWGRWLSPGVMEHKKGGRV